MLSTRRGRVIHRTGMVRLGTANPATGFSVSYTCNVANRRKVPAIPTYFVHWSTGRPSMRYAATLICLAACLQVAQGAALHLLEHPAMNKTHIVFSYAGDLWSVPRAGGAAARLTSGVGFESEPSFSPDGSTIAFTGEYDGNVDVYTIPASGGVPKRVTYHPDADRVVGWTPDGKRILFRSNRLSYSRYFQLYTVS